MDKYIHTFSSVNWEAVLPIIIPIIVIQLILLAVALFSLKKAPATRGPKLLWALIIIFVSILGPVLYFVIGKEEQ
ncbi:PLDc_N domain-containing protein [Paenibacillus albiflavus]|uniref:PLDc_N domain-containing protein n=1 Tax=Paenibacillus albiflavus TaxID=2545760 RepID=A0A4R4EFC4_9BACL|nr:PLD nuclease N-terminal domain-containing protein [Paenibacillus albiflavus]TCZ78766.1 PLDc_N domain-containing protein [Paenibacillus albiflavus]